MKISASIAPSCSAYLVLSLICNNTQAFLSIPGTVPHILITSRITPKFVDELGERLDKAGAHWALQAEKAGETEPEQVPMDLDLEQMFEVSMFVWISCVRAS